ncbi:MAG: hypothetical protein B6U87_02125 [Candidatus Aenigmarchaeota archaeon ex4484_52]|nr:MAG: hypothetical protein B6U87_02125 [Candidatus Aenigmarchaeota archaeon ex4484_52]
MDSITLLGLIAAFLTTIALIPQFLKIYKTKQTKDISIGMYILYCFGFLSWLIYGFGIKSTPIILANIFALTFSLIILYFKIKYK